MKISINFKVLWDSLSEKSLRKKRDLRLKSCIHSGNAGDIIYSLPTLKELGANHYIINLCTDPGFGGRNIDFSTARALAPLLLAQPYIERVTIVSSNLPLEYLKEPIGGIDFNLDKFRLQDVFKHHLAISHAMAFGLYINLYEKWLYVEKDLSDHDYIVISLTPRYRSLPKEYWLEVLSGLDNIKVIGIPQEFHCLSGITADFITCTDFLEMVKIIQGSRLFIGNPNLCYAIAEGLKVQRIVELHSEFQNAYPIGRSGYRAPSSIEEARNLIHRLISDSSGMALPYQNTTLLRKTVDLERVIKEKETHIDNLESTIREKETHIGNLERQGEENYRDWQAHEKNLEAAIRDKETHIGNLERQGEENYRDWQAHEKNFKGLIQDREQHIQNLETVVKNKDDHLKSLEAEITNLNETVSQKEAHAANLESILKDKDSHITNLESELIHKDSQIKDKETHVSNLESAVREKEAHAANLESILKDKDSHITNLESELTNKNSQIKNIETSLKDKENILNRIYHSYGLSAFLVCNKLIDKIFPHNSRRQLFAKIILGGFSNPKAILKSLNKNNIKLFIHYVKNADPAVIVERAETLVFKEAVLMHCEKAILLPGSLEVAGWTISPRGIDKIEIYCDNYLLGFASYGLSRPDVHAVYPFIKNSVNPGFYFSMLLEKTLSVGQHHLRIKAIAVDGQSSETNLLIDVADPYPKYLIKNTPKEGTLRWMREVSDHLTEKPFIHLFILLKEDIPNHLSRTLDSVVGQVYPFWKMLLFYDKEPCEETMRTMNGFLDQHQNKLSCFPSSEINHRLSMEDYDLAGFITSGDFLHPHTLFEIVKYCNMKKTTDLIYTDEDTFIDGNRKDPIFKPDWSPDLLLSMNYIGQFFLAKKERLTQVGGLHIGLTSEGIYDLLLRVTELTREIGHVPSLLYTKARDEEDSQQARMKVLEKALLRRGIKGEIIPLGNKDTYRVRRSITGYPKVSIIILTAYKTPESFEKCINSIMRKSTYNNFEIIIVDHSYGKLSKASIKKLIPESKLKIIEYKEDFNFSRMNNLTVTKAEGDYLILLNDDTEVITPDWMEAMLEHAQCPDVGVVGVKLLYPDDTVQHGGMFLVDYGGGARHAFRYFSKDSNGYFGFLNVVRNVSAVTFACVMVSKDVFSTLGGLDEELEVECNDVDFCLRAINAGYRVVWTPFAVLYHKELSTRKVTYFKNDIDYFWNRWRSLLEGGDPYYNPNLTLDADDFSLNMRPVLIEHHEPTYQ